LLNSAFLGDLPEIHETITIPNHKSTYEHPEALQKYIEDDLKRGRIDGPFTKAEIESIVGGAFISEPLTIAIQDQGPGLPAKYRVCRDLS
jgi:hypothetical protein